MTLHLVCAYEVIILPSKSYSTFHHFFLQFLHVAEIGQKAHNTRNLIPPILCISQLLTTFNLYSGRARMGLQVKLLGHRRVNTECKRE